MSKAPKIERFIVLKDLDSKAPTFYIANSEQEAEKILRSKRQNKGNNKSRKPNSDPDVDFDSLLDGCISSFTPYYKLADVAPHIGNALALVKINSEIIDKREKYQLINKSRSGEVYKLNDAQSAAILKSLKEARSYTEAFRVIPASILMSIVSTFDAHLAGIARFALMNNRQQITNSKREIKAIDVFKFSSFDELLENIVYEEIYKIMWESHQKQVSKFEELFSIEIVPHFNNWGEFIEVFERRNLIAHGETRATSRYFTNCIQANISSNSDRLLQEGKPVTLEGKYIRVSADYLVLFLLLFTFVIWCKQDPDKFGYVYGKMNRIAFDLLKIGRHTLATRLLETMVNWRSQSIDEATHRMMVINLANGYRHLGDNPKSLETLKKYNWSVCADNFRICEASVRGDVELVCSLLPNFKNETLISKDSFRTWPVFDWMKEEVKFLDAFQTVFGEDFVIPE